MTLNKKKYWQKGFSIGIALWLFGLLCLLLQFLSWYHGECGELSILPAIGSGNPYHCSFIAYAIIESPFFILRVLGFIEKFWPVVLAVLIIPVLIGAMIDKAFAQ